FVQVFLGGNVDVRLRVGARLQLLDLGGERHDLGLEFGHFAVLRRLRGGGEAGRAERGGKRGSKDRVTHVMDSRWCVGGWMQTTPRSWRCVRKHLGSDALAARRAENGAV